MKTAVLIIGFISVAWAFPKLEEEPEFRALYVDVDEDISGDVVTRIVNGHEAKPHSIPYQVYMRVFAVGTSWLCSGSLISRKYVLTAAHCIRNGVKAQVFLGFHNLNKQEPYQLMITTTKLKRHDNYDNKDIIRDDIGVIELPYDVELNEDINIVQLPTRDELDNYEGKEGRISGWGRVTGAGSTSLVLLEANSTIISNRDCDAALRVVQDYQVCISGDHGVASCNGDSGGPLVVENKQVGIVSYGVKNCAPGYPSVSTRISSFLDWIEDHTDLMLK